MSDNVDKLDNTLASIVEIVTLSQTSEVNERLKKGWVLLKIFTTCYDTVGSGVNHQTCYCVLGRTALVEPFIEPTIASFGNTL